MKFCPLCRNMLFEITESDKSAVLNCRRCEYKEMVTSSVVYEHKLTSDDAEQYMLNPNLKYDPTLEHFTNIVCPNKECPSITQDQTPDVVAIKLNAEKLIWLYQCSNCNASWKQMSRAT